MSDDLPPLGKEWLDGEDDPFVFMAAKASWVAPLIAFGLGFAGSCILSNVLVGDPNATRLPQLVIGTIGLVLALTGFCLGVYALFGIRTYGIERILIPAIIGIMLSSVYVGLVIVAFVALRG